MACTFFKAMGFETGKSLVESDRVDMAKSCSNGGHAADAAPRRDGRTALDEPQRGARRGARRDPADEAMFDIGPRIGGIDSPRHRRGARR